MEVEQANTRGEGALGEKTGWGGVVEDPDKQRRVA